MQLCKYEQATSKSGAPCTHSLMEPDGPASLMLHESPTAPTNIHEAETFKSMEFTADAGVIPDTEGVSMVDYFRLIFDDWLLNLIFTETNRYADQYVQRERVYLGAYPKAQTHDWKKCAFTLKEWYAFLALIIGMGLLYAFE